MLNVNEIPHKGLKSYIAKLARQNHISYINTRSSLLAQTITRLADDDVKPDETEKLVIALRRANVIDGSQMLILLGRYFDETQHV
ncbi:hypothetical protein [Acinetobacter guillouiae]|uniref:Uncharacterized protein n=1 Tax=Acinetobacter guillouiae NIPH 991 TaxID=1217656 RepID=N8Y4C7_ACIGI|nr:hypothetical protein [Acinetobacter guillouiae]ENV16184.1 hypothetical protein F964_03119 [Acinetobacter guillouiae NIPH 991]